MSEIRVEPGYGASLIIAILMRRLGETEVVLTDRDLEEVADGTLTWTTSIDPTGGNGSYIRLRVPERVIP